MVEFIIVFRETLEASLIIGILYTYLSKSNQQSAIRQLWLGVTYALIASVIGSVLFQIFAGGFHGQAEKLFEGIVMIVAAITLGTMIVWMAKNHNIADEIKSQAKSAIENKQLGYGILGLAFVSVFREGIETILFLYGTMMKQGDLSIILSLAGGVIGTGMGYVIFVQGKKIPLKVFFNVSSILLIFVAAGMMAYGVHELESAKVIPYLSGTTEKIELNNNDVTEYEIVATRLSGYSKTFSLDEQAKAEKWASRTWDINPPKNDDGTYPLFHDKGSAGSLIKGLFGYNGDPSLIELLVWFASVSGLLYMWKIVSKSSSSIQSKE